MLPTFVICLREGVEAALIVSIIATFLRQENRLDALRWVWLGVIGAAVLCLGIGIVLELINEDLPQRQQEMLETVVGGVAVGIVTFMLVWMRRNAAGLSKELRASAGAALKQGSVSALIGMAFFAVFREGLETAVFLLAIFQNADDPGSAGLGAVLGLVAAVVIGFAIYRGGIKLNYARFFRFTGLVLALVAAGLVASTLHTAHEAGWVNFGQDQAFDLTWLVVPGTWTAALLTGMLGIQPQPTTIEVIGYLVYLVPAIVYILIPARFTKRAKERRMQNTAVAAVAITAAALFLSACGSSDDKSSGGAGTKQVAVKLTDAGCEPATLKLGAGRTEFKVTNGGTGRVSEMEVLSGSRILGEKENLVSGLSGSFTVTLEPGQYAMSCPGGKTAATGVIAVSGKAVADATAGNPLLKSATASYASYVTNQVKILVDRTTKFTAAVKAGDVAEAKAQFAAARSPYETIEPVAESFGNLDPEIDARVNDVAKGDKWTGFHRIEQGLWVKNSTKGLAPIADKLLADVKRLETKTTGLTYKPEELANGANGLLDEVSSSKITGEEDRYSHTDLSDFEANVNGSETAFGLLAPALRKTDPQLATTIAARFDAVNARLAQLKQGNAYPSYDTVDSAERKRLSQLVDALAEPLSKVASKLAA